MKKTRFKFEHSMDRLYPAHGGNIATWIDVFQSYSQGGYLDHYHNNDM